MGIPGDPKLNDYFVFIITLLTIVTDGLNKNNMIAKFLEIHSASIRTISIQTFLCPMRFPQGTYFWARNIFAEVLPHLQLDQMFRVDIWLTTRSIPGFNVSLLSGVFRRL